MRQYCSPCGGGAAFFLKRHHAFGGELERTTGSCIDIWLSYLHPFYSDGARPAKAGTNWRPSGTPAS